METQTIRIPDGWHEVNVETFQELSKLNSLEGLHKVIELVSVLTDKDPDEIKLMSAEDFEKILKLIEWTSSVPDSDYKTDVEIDENIYYLVKLKNLTLGEWIDLDTWMNDSISNMHKILALLYRPEKENYDYNKMNERSELFLKKLMINDVYGAILFFLIIGNQYLKLIKDYTKETQKTKS